jgi:hypothetical protein
MKVIHGNAPAFHREFELEAIRLLDLSGRASLAKAGTLS